MLLLWKNVRDAALLPSIIWHERQIWTVCRINWRSTYKLDDDSSLCKFYTSKHARLCICMCSKLYKWSAGLSIRNSLYIYDLLLSVCLLIVWLMRPHVASFTPFTARASTSKSNIYLQLSVSSSIFSALEAQNKIVMIHRYCSTTGMNQIENAHAVGNARRKLCWATKLWSAATILFWWDAML